MRKNGFWEKMFPVKRDFYQMIRLQAEASARVTASLECWINRRSKETYSQLLQEVETADQLRFDLEDKLIEAFATPFDRQDIYSLSNDMNRIVEYAKSTMLEIEAFEIKTEDIIIEQMIHQLVEGTNSLVKAIQLLKEEPINAQTEIRNIRKFQESMEGEYRAGLALLFQSSDIMNALKYKEVYHHIKDAAGVLGYTTDTLHRIIMRIV